MAQLIYEKLAAIMKAAKPIKKSRTNTSTSGAQFKYRGIDEVMNDLHDIFADNDVFLTTDVINREETERVSKSCNALFYVRCTCKFTLYTTDGSFISSTTIGEGMDSGDKGTNKAMSIALKYALLQMFLIPTDDAKDPDAESHEVKAKTDIKNTAGMQTPKPTSKPKLTPVNLKKVLDRMVAGEPELYQKTLDAYDLDDKQKIELDEAKSAMMPIDNEPKIF